MLFCSHIGCKLTLIIVLFALLYYKLSLTLSMYKVYLTHHCFCDLNLIGHAMVPLPPVEITCLPLAEDPLGDPQENHPEDHLHVRGKELTAFT